MTARGIEGILAHEEPEDGVQEGLTGSVVEYHEV